MTSEFVAVLGGYLLGASIGLELLSRFSTSPRQSWPGTLRQKLWVLLIAELGALLGSLSLFWLIRDPRIPNLGMSWMLLWFSTMFLLGGLLQYPIRKGAEQFLSWWTKPPVVHVAVWPEVDDAPEGRPSSMYSGPD